MERIAVNGLDDVEPNEKTAAAPDGMSSKDAQKRAIDFVLLGILFGVVAGLMEFVLRWFISYGLHQPSNHDFGLDLLWVLPLANLLLLGAAGLVMGLASFRWHGDTLLRIAVAAFAAATAMVVLLHFRSLHAIVSVILSVGVGVRLADVAGRRPDRLRRLARRATWPAVAAVALIAVAIRSSEALTERRAAAKLIGAPANAPNVLIIVMDAARAPNLSAYGYARQTTPELERLAERSVLFERAIVTAPWSLTSHASIFTGRYPHEMSADWDVPLDSKYPTLAEVLRNRGYLTAGFVANGFYGKPEFGLNRGFMHYESRKFDVVAMIATAKLGNALVGVFNRLTNSYDRPARMNASEINRRLLSWLPSRGSRPFFIFVNYFDAHEPYVAPAPYNRLFSAAEPPTRQVREGHRNTEAELRGLRDAYDQALAYVDSQLGALLRELERRELGSNTLVIVTSDHGEEFGEHGWAHHGNGLYLPGLRVPLLISFPGHIPGGKVVAEPVTLRDLPATVSHLVGLGDRSAFPGSSLFSRLASAVDSPGTTRSPVLSEVKSARNAPSWYAVAKGDMKSIIIGRHHYILNGDGREELFDIVADPWETIDLAKTEGGKTMLVSARAALDSATGATRAAAANDQLH